MARTFRRKNGEITLGIGDSKYRKSFGWYGVLGYREGVNGFFFDLVAPNKDEAFREWYKIHGDKEAFFDAPPPDYRKRQIRKEKLNYKKQFQRWLNNPTFEIIEQMKLAYNCKGWY